jgi:hypothetical protein
MRDARAPATCLVIVVLALGCSGSCCAPAVTADGWQPAWIDSPPRPDVDLEVKPMRWAPVDDVSLVWRFEGKTTFGYDVRNRLRTVDQASKKGPEENETTGTIMFRPLEDGRAEVRITTHLVSGGAAPAARTYIMDPAGRLEDPDPRTQSMLGLIFPVLEKGLATGESAESLSVIPDAGGNAETRTRTVVGIVGFARVEGHKCAIVAADHEARIWSRKVKSDPLEDSGNVSRLQLLGYFDIKEGRYVAVAVSELSITVRKAGEIRTEREASYILKGIAGS